MGVEIFEIREADELPDVYIIQDIAFTLWVFLPHSFVLMPNNARRPIFLTYSSDSVAMKGFSDTVTIHQSTAKRPSRFISSMI